MRKIYILIQKGATLSHLLSWLHYVEIIALNDLDEINYFVKENNTIIFSTTYELTVN